VAVCFYLQVWNIGAEGQFAFGAIGGTAVVLAFPSLPAWAMLPLMLLAASFAGAFWAAIPAILHEKFKTNEIISTLMLNYLAILFLQYLVFGPWKDPNGMGFPMTNEFSPAAVMPEIIDRIHGGVVLCILASIGLTVFLNRTRYGYELLAGGANPAVAHYAGMSYSSMVIGVMCLCGALAALAGCIEISPLSADCAQTWW
jgi:simple sugar transport system permease protein